MKTSNLDEGPKIKMGNIQSAYLIIKVFSYAEAYE